MEGTNVYIISKNCGESMDIKSKIQLLKYSSWKVEYSSLIDGLLKT